MPSYLEQGLNRIFPDLDVESLLAQLIFRTNIVTVWNEALHAEPPTVVSLPPVFSC